MARDRLYRTLLVALALGCGIGTAWAQRGDKKRAKTTFQTAAQWKPVTDVRADAVMVYGTVDRPGLTFEQRMRSWAEKGYNVQFMTGVAWGDYQDYFLGKWDGVDGHLKEGQRDRQGNEIAHGHLVPYIVPTASFIRYMQQEQVKRVIDAGITSIYLEEPEFWMRGGYSEAFKAEWEKYYGFPWRPQHESPENTYLSNKLKYYLYYNALDEIFTYAKAYGRSKGVEVKCYVPTHSLINYTSWQIVSPEASLASLDCVDGYIAQVWTGTAREPNYYNGVCRERVFENAFLEYGCMESMTAPLGREMYFLTDPIEDRGRDWADYKRNYQATFVAQLMYPQVETYEVMPWPDRIYEGLYRVAGTDRKERIPRDYSTQMQVMINTLNDIRATDSRVEGTHGIGVLMKFYLDGDDEYPTICGTGTEDYFGGAWSFASHETGKTVEQNYCTPFLGYPFYANRDTTVYNRYHNDDVPPMRGFYRWHIPDPIHFERDIRVTLQQIGVCHRGLFERQDDVATVAYWYQDEPYVEFPQLPSPEERWPR